MWGTRRHHGCSSPWCLCASSLYCAGRTDPAGHTTQFTVIWLDRDAESDNLIGHYLQSFPQDVGDLWFSQRTSYWRTKQQIQFQTWFRTSVTYNQYDVILYSVFMFVNKLHFPWAHRTSWFMFVSGSTHAQTELKYEPCVSSAAAGSNLFIQASP